MASRHGRSDDDVDAIIIEQADEQLTELAADGVGQPGAAEAVVNDPIPADPAESLLYEQTYETNGTPPSRASHSVIPKIDRRSIPRTCQASAGDRSTRRG